MYIIARSHLPNEFGGIFVGIKYNNFWHITDFEIPTKYTHSKTGFTRNADNLNSYLKDIYQKSNGKIEYLGEWHSHPFGSTMYSTNDFNSMSEIAKEENTKNRTPILAILSISHKKNQCKFYHYQGNCLIELI
jgi:integrative and conjugative element protein (TIGR02256 family)